MDPVAWTRIEKLFDGAVERAPDERTAWLRQACGDDPALYGPVAAMLDADDRPAPILGQRAMAALHDEAGLAGQTVGPWRVAEHVGVGGMGTVYRAERADGPYEQTVALKLVKRGMDTDAVLRRFESERRILARLEHPGIARLVDGGLAENGRPYLAMEFVEGEPITDYCDRRKLGVDARLQLVADACEAVAYAHQRLVVHRDLKPSNLLVADTADGPRVKLLDFGIAKVLEDDDTAVLTQTGQRPFTPSYAAPEQLHGGAITTATDVYGLGAVLYRLLAGARPTPSEGRSPAQVEIAVLTEEPAPPSRVVRGQGEVAAARGTTPERLARRLARDLDWIVLRALRKDPAERYADARALLADLRRYRDGLPVEARPPSGAYVARKFADRHRTALGVTGVALAAVGLVMALAFARVTSEADRANAQADRARAEAGKAEQVATLLADLFAKTDPAETPGADTVVRDLLARGTAQVDADLANEPALRAQMLTVMGRMYRRRGLYPEADSLLGRALVLRQSLGVPGHPDIAGVLDELGLLREDLGDYAEARRLLRRALAIRHAHPSADPLPLATTLHTLASVNRQLGRYREGEAQIRASIALKEAAYGEPHSDVANSLAVLGTLLSTRELNSESLRERYDGSQRERYAEAEAANRRALTIRRGVLGPDHLDVASSLQSLAGTYRFQRRWADAEPLLRDALRIWEAHQGPDFGKTTLTRSQLASVIGMQGRGPEARALHDQALASARRTFAPGHPTLTIVLLYRGEMLTELGQAEEALGALQEGAAMYRPRLGPGHPEATRGSLRIAVAYARLGRLADAEHVIGEVEAACGSATSAAELCAGHVARARARVAEARAAPAS